MIKVNLIWERCDLSQRAEFRAEALGNVFLAYRHRTGYGWSWWEVHHNGKDIGNTGDLPTYSYVPEASVISI